jgi:hypothetical protein
MTDLILDKNTTEQNLMQHLIGLTESMLDKKYTLA